MEPTAAKHDGARRSGDRPVVPHDQPSCEMGYSQVWFHTLSAPLRSVSRLLVNNYSEALIHAADQRCHHSLGLFLLPGGLPPRFTSVIHFGGLPRR
jgi:hypothetical protein